MINITCISDLHGHQPQLEGGDLLIIAGDMTGRDHVQEWVYFYQWLKKQDYRKKVMIAGNHDGFLENCLSSQAAEEIGIRLDYDFEYLCDSGCEFEGLKIWGSPWTPKFHKWYFMKERGAQIKEKWDLIPKDTDILVTHGPSFGILDDNARKERCGCEELRLKVEEIKPKLHVFGHIHESYGEMILKCTPRDVLCINASIMDEYFQPVNKPIRVIL